MLNKINKYKKQLGYTMIEVMLVLGIVVSSATIIFVISNKAYHYYNLNKELQKLNFITESGINLRALQKNYAGLDNNYVKNHGLPMGTDLKTYYGGDIVVSSIAENAPDDNFQVEYTNTPTHICTEIATKTIDYYAIGKINGTDIPRDTSGLPKIAESLDLCKASDNNTITLIYKLLDKKCAPQSVAWGPGNACTAFSPTELLTFDHVVMPAISVTHDGSGNFMCENGVLVERSGTTCTPKPCAAQDLTWTDSVTGADCTANFPASVHDAVKITSTLIDTDKTGTGTSKCQFGVWQNTIIGFPGASGTCQKKCIAPQTISWHDPATNEDCSGDAGGPFNAGDTVPANTVTPFAASGKTGLGGDSVCNGTTGLLAGGSGTCEKNCASGTVNWTDPSTGQNCQGTMPATIGGATSASFPGTNTSSSGVGTATAVCNNGTPTATGTCSVGCTIYTGTATPWPASSPLTSCMAVKISSSGIQFFMPDGLYFCGSFETATIPSLIETSVTYHEYMYFPGQRAYTYGLIPTTSIVGTVMNFGPVAVSGAPGFPGLGGLTGTFDTATKTLHFNTGYNRGSEQFSATLIPQGSACP